MEDVRHLALGDIVPGGMTDKITVNTILEIVIREFAY